MVNNLIPKPGTIHEVRKYYNSFERERSLSNFACTVNVKTQFVLLDIILRAAFSLRQPNNFISQTGSNDLDFFPINKIAYIAHCHFDLRLRYWTLWTQISVKVIPYDAVARRSQRVIDSIYFGMYRRTHLQRFLLSFGFLAFQFQSRYAYSRGKNSKMWNSLYIYLVLLPSMVVVAFQGDNSMVGIYTYVI